jgi:cob(I)alamin adenosyltransferase
MRITRVYTRTGDRGTTRLVGGQEVPKDHPRLAAYGTVDELNAILGIVRVETARATMAEEARARIDAMLAVVQNECFDVGSDLATREADRWPGMVRVGGDEVTRLENWIDTLNEDVGPLKEFILPGGGPVGAFLHQARVVCRRAEREVAAAMREEPEIGDGPLRYLNRCSDFLFVLGRWAAQQAGEREVHWQRDRARG